MTFQFFCAEPSQVWRIARASLGRCRISAQRSMSYADLGTPTTDGRAAWNNLALIPPSFFFHLTTQSSTSAPSNISTTIKMSRIICRWLHRSSAALSTEPHLPTTWSPLFRPSRPCLPSEKSLFYCLASMICVPDRYQLHFDFHLSTVSRLDVPKTYVRSIPMRYPDSARLATFRQVTLTSAATHTQYPSGPTSGSILCKIMAELTTLFI